MRTKKKWEWKEGKIERSAPHIGLFFDEWGKSCIPIALVAQPVETSFVVEFLDAPQIEPSEYEKIRRKIAQELDFYLVDKDEPDPLGYAIYHCRTAANAYSDVHWSFLSDSSASKASQSAPTQLELDFDGFSEDTSLRNSE